MTMTLGKGQFRLWQKKKKKKKKNLSRNIKTLGASAIQRELFEKGPGLYGREIGYRAGRENAKDMNENVKDMNEN